MSQNIAIIPARGGSKRIPRKNVKDFRGNPMISYAINAAKSSGLFERIVVSTDDREIKDIALEYGAEVPFLRPPELANDTAGTLPVIQDAIRQIQGEGSDLLNVACIYPTVPLLRGEDLIAAYGQFIENNCESFLIAAHPFEYPVQRGFTFSETSGLEMLFPEEYNTRSQDLAPVYHDAGQFYIASSRVWLHASRMYEAASRLWIVDRDRSIDIDTPSDWIEAEKKAAFIDGYRD